MGKHSEWRQSEAGQEGAYREMTENIKNKKLIQTNHGVGIESWHLLQF